MSNVDAPPNPYFNGINFNSSFFPSISAYLTEAIANSKYLKLIGGILRGNLGIKRTPAVELDVNGKAFINNNIFATPSNGVYGGDGSRLILAPGTASATPYSLGIASSTLWYGTPDGARHDYYVGTTNIATFSNSSTEILALKAPTNTNYQLLFAPPSATSAAAIQTVQQGTGYNQDLTLQSVAGNVGIGTSNPDNILQVGSGGRLRIANNDNDYSLIGTRNVDDGTLNTKILSGLVVPIPTFPATDCNVKS